MFKIPLNPGEIVVEDKISASGWRNFTDIWAAVDRDGDVVLHVVEDLKRWLDEETPGWSWHCEAEDQRTFSLYIDFAHEADIVHYTLQWVR